MTDHDLPQAAVDAAYAARYGEPVDDYTWNRVADAVLAAARLHLLTAWREQDAQPPAAVYLMHHRFERGEEFGVFAMREDAETAAGRRREEGDPAALIEVIGCAVIGGKLAQAKAVEMAVAAERERCARLASEQAEDYERSFGVADGPETLGRLEAAHDALVSLAALLKGAPRA